MKRHHPTCCLKCRAEIRRLEEEISTLKIANAVLKQMAGGQSRIDAIVQEFNEMTEDQAREVLKRKNEGSEVRS